MVATYHRKVYVSVNLDIDEYGVHWPRLIRWKGGESFQIEQILQWCRTHSQRAGDAVVRYTVRIRGQQSFLFHEGDKWFVEAKEGCL